MKLFSNQYIRYGLFVVIGLFLGWLFFHSSDEGKDQKNTSEITQAEIWTCSMHPQIRMDKQGKCPLCAMDLILLNQNSAEAMDPDEIHFTKEALQLANVMTSVVSKQESTKELRLYGKVQADERLIQSQVAYIPGRIERLHVNFTGESVRKGQLLALIYSPDLITAQQELLETVKTKNSYPEIYEAAKEKLLQWKLSAKQIATIESSKKVKTNVEVYATSSGIVTNKFINVGDYVGQGTVLFEVTDLSRVWLLFDAYESDIQFLKKGNKLDFTVQSIPNSNFSGIINFIDPVIDPNTRVAKVRLEITNKDNKLKPEMFATGFVKANLDQYQNKMVIPKTAVLWTGKRSIVYVKKPGNDPIFKVREIEIGPMLGNSYVVENGLSEGEEVVTQGVFSVDAAAQLEGKPSMMNTEGGKVSTGHENHTDAQNTNEEEAKEITKKIAVSSKFQQQLKLVFNDYIKIKNALTNDDGKTSQKSAAELLKSLNAVDMKLLTNSESHTNWMAFEKVVRNTAKVISTNVDIKIQREQFLELSKSISKSVELFGINQKVFKQFCPMANNDKGAIWLSTEEKIMNPYFGASMLQCGTVELVIK